MHIFVIPARGGSKRLPRKNLHNLWGKPLLIHSIEAALNLPLAEQKVVVVSSEDSEILELARSVAGVHALTRPDELALDDVPTQLVLKHAVSSVERFEGVTADIVWWMNASVPQVTPSDLSDGYRFLIEKDLLEITTVNSEGIAYAAVRLMRRRALFADRLSTHFGVIHRDYIDIHLKEDILFLEALKHEKDWT